MAILNIVYYPDSPLTDTAEPVTQFGAHLEELVQDMFETMRAYEGVGLAAPQIGLSKRLFIAQPPEGEELVVVNPVLEKLEGREVAQEGCLSMPEVYADVPRATSLVLKAQDVFGERFEMEVTDFLARVIQHEFDHLEGVMFPERLDILSRQAVMKEWDEVRARLFSGSQAAPGGHAAK